VLSELVNNGMIWFALIGIIMSVIAAYYYLRVVWFMYFENNDQAIGNNGILNAQSITSIMVSAMLLLIGLYPNPIIQYIRSIISSFLLID
jgi:NADH-quinone oxidoreductase subunit N